MQQITEKKAKWYRRAFFAAICAFVLMCTLYLATVALQRMDVMEQEGLRELYHGQTSRFSFSLITSAKAEEDAEVPERFQKLWDINKDLIGWLKVGDAVDEPVVYCSDNAYYMDHSFYKKINTSGTIFADKENAQWATTPFVVLYGHNMRSGTEFGDLSRYRKLDYFKQNALVVLDTIQSEKPEQYVPFAVFDASMDTNNANYFYLRRFADFKNGDMKNVQLFLDEVKDRSIFSVPVEVAPDDRILVLVTCSYADTDGRFMVFCRELRDGETTESVQAAIAKTEKQ